MMCPSCGQANPAGSFCTACGVRLQPVPPAAGGAERKQVTALFASRHDQDSVELMELNNRDPEAARTFVESVLESMMDAVHRYEGVVVSVMGDGIEALFGVPLVHEDHALRACCAALRMQETVKRYAEDARRVYGVKVHIRAGLNSGEVVVRYLSPSLHMDFRAFGNPVTVASHLMDAAEPGTVLVGSATRAAVQSVAHVESVEPLRIEGRREPIAAYRLLGIERTSKI